MGDDDHLLCLQFPGRIGLDAARGRPGPLADRYGRNSVAVQFRSHALDPPVQNASAPLYVAHCAKCHGPAGGGIGKAPAVVGKNALPLNPPPGAQHRTTQFHTAKDVLDFIRANMPADNPGSLSETQYADILAFDLKLNGLDLHHERVNEENASNFVLHPDNFASQVP